MSETQESAGQPLDAGTASEVAGGNINVNLNCSPEQLQIIVDGLKENYDKLVDFTSYVIGRIAGETTSGP